MADVTGALLHGAKAPTDIPGPRRFSDSDDDIIEMWQTRKQYAQQMRQPYETQWVKNWKLYRAHMESVTDPQDWWRSNEFIPEMFNSVETILPRHILGMYSRPEWFDTTCPHSSYPGHPGMSCSDYERMIKSLLLGGTKRMDLFKSSYMGHKYGLIMGHSWWKLRWERDERNRVMDMPIQDPTTGEVVGMSSELVPWVAYDDPRLEWVSNFRVWADPTGNDEWFIEEIETTREKLEAMQRRYGVYKNLSAVALQTTTIPKDPMNRNTPYAGSAGQLGEEQISAIEGFSRAATDEAYDGTKVVLLACSGRVPYTARDGVQWRRTVIANDVTVIRDGPNPTPDLKPEFFGVQSIPIPGFVYGDSVLRYAGPLNEQLNRIENFRMDEVVLGIWQQYVANRNAVTSNQMLFQPGGVVWVDTAQDVQTAFRVLDRRPILPDAYRESAVKRDQLERATGATATQQGATAADRETATSVGARVQLGSERFRLATMWQNMTFKKPLLSRMFELYKRHLPPDRLVRLIGTDQQLRVDISQIQDDIDINIDADVFEIDNAAKQQALAFFLQTATAPPFAPFWRVPELLRDAVEAYLQKDGRRYVRSEEEVQMLMAAQAQAALFAGAAPGANSAGAGGGQQGGGRGGQVGSGAVPRGLLGA